MRAKASDSIGRSQKKKPKKSRKSKKAKRPSRIKRLGRYLLVAIVIFIAVSWALVLPLRWINPPTTAFMLQDNSGRIPVLYEWHNWDELVGPAPLAVVASEDQKFADHFGFDLKSIQTSVQEFQDGEPLRGASTISQQVAKNMYLWPGKSFLRKGVEAYITLLIEASLPKRRILEIYLNIAELGPGIYGVGAASKIYFNKSPKELSDADAALLAATLPNPNRLRADQPSDYVRERQRWILHHLRRLDRERWINLID